MATSSEFDRIRSFFAPLTEGFDGADGLRDDAAVLKTGPDEELVLTTDTIVEKVHFLGPEPPDTIAKKLLRMNLSDLAAKGAVPSCYFLNVALPARIEDQWLEQFCRGLQADQADYGIVLAGGDTVGTDGPVVLTVSALGTVRRGGIVRRSGARPGDRLLVTGTIGDGAFGLRCARGDFLDLDAEGQRALTAAYQVPRPAVRFGVRAARHFSAALDVSDGLIADAGHLAAASGVSLRIESCSVPLSDPVAELVSGSPELLADAVTGGDDYQILFTAEPEMLDMLHAVALETGTRLTQIGTAEPGEGVVFVDRDGDALPLPKSGFQHS